MNNDFDKYYEATEPGYRERAIGWPTAIGDLHRNAAANDGVNDGVKSALNGTEENAVKAILRNGRINALELAFELGVKKRQAERVIATLKSKAGLKRRGADKNGEWYFESARSPLPPASKLSKHLAKSNKERGKKKERAGFFKKGRNNEK